MCHVLWASRGFLGVENIEGFGLITCYCGQYLQQHSVEQWRVVVGVYQDDTTATGWCGGRDENLRQKSKKHLRKLGTFSRLHAPAAEHQLIVVIRTVRRLMKALWTLRRLKYLHTHTHRHTQTHTHAYTHTQTDTHTDTHTWAAIPTFFIFFAKLSLYKHVCVYTVIIWQLSLKQVEQESWDHLPS